MSDGGANIKRHVRAAREWLGRAENSLEREDTIRGDLNIMLAQAEIMRARETKSMPKWRVWLIRALPMAVAAGIAAMVIGIVPGSPGTARVAPPMAPPAPEAAVPVAERTAAPAAIPPSPMEAVLPVAEEITEEPPLVSEDAMTEMAPEAPPAMEAPAAEATPRIPSIAMQRLMSSAGQSLRAQ